MSKRPEFSKKIKLQAFERSGGRCEKCSAKLSPGNTEFHHIIEATMAVDGDARFAALDNCSVVCRSCHSSITRSRAPVLAKSSRQRAKHLGIARKSARPLPFGKASRFKKKLDGSVVER